MAANINTASEEVDRFLQSYKGRQGRTPVEVRSHPSGDDMNAIKVWVNLGSAAESDDLHAWCADAETAIRAALGDKLGDFTLELRADAM
jgi:hypothetical protein